MVGVAFSASSGATEDEEAALDGIPRILTSGLLASMGSSTEPRDTMGGPPPVWLNPPLSDDSLSDEVLL